MTARASEFIFVKCSDKKTAEAVQAGSPPSIVAFDCDGEKIGSYHVKTVDSILRAMDQIQAQYCDREILWNTANREIFGEALRARKPIVLFFDDASKKESQEVAKALEHRAIAKHHSKVVFVKIPFTKDSEPAALWGVRSAPAVLFVDPAQEPGRKAVLEERIGKQKPHALRAMFLKALEKAKKAGAGRS